MSTRTSPHRTALIVLGVAALAAALGIGAANLHSAFGGASVVGGVLLVLLAATPTIARLRTDHLDGPGLFALVTALELGLVSLTWLGTPPGAGPGLMRADVARALAVVALGIAVFGIGAHMTWRTRRPGPLVIPAGLRPSRGALMLAFGLSVLGAFVGAAQNSFGYISSSGPSALGQLFSFFDVLGGIIVLITALLYFHDRDPRLRLPLVAFAALQLALGFVSGVKTSAVQPLVFIGLAYIVCRGRVPWRAALLLVAFTLLVVVPLATTYRESVRVQSETAPQALAQALANPAQGGIGHVVSQSYDYVVGRFRHIDSVALIVSRTPSTFPYAGGRLYFELPALIVVPRAIWPGKPQLDQGLQFTHTYWDAPDIQSSTPLTSVGDLFRNFGIAGVVIGMLLWGIVIGWWQRLRHRLRSPRIELVFLYSLLYFVANVESDLPENLATAAKTLPLVAIVGWLLLPGKDGSQPGYRRLLGSTV